MAAAPTLPATLFRAAADLASGDPGALAAIAVRAFATGDAELALGLLGAADRETALIGMATLAPAEWEEALLAPIRELREGPRADARAALIPRLPPERRTPLFEEAARAADGYKHAAAPRRLRVLVVLAPELARLRRSRWAGFGARRCAPPPSALAARSW
jgi:hypothetical protein